MNEPRQPESLTELDVETFNEAQLLLSEKRTALSTLRTGIALFVFPLSVLSVLIATSQSYHVSEVLHWLIPLLVLNAGLVALAVYLVILAVKRIHRYDHLLDELKRKNHRLAELMD